MVWQTMKFCDGGPGALKQYQSANRLNQSGSAPVSSSFVPTTNNDV
jgi:hypothetical protein